MYKNIKNNLQLLYTNFLCSILFVRNLFFERKMHIKQFVYSSQLTIKGNETEINWKVVGCHKIVISSLAVLSGNISHLKIKLENRINHFEITFYGIGGQKQTKLISIESTSPSVLNTFSFKTNLSNMSSVSLMRKNLKKSLLDSFNYQIPKGIKLNKPKILRRNLKINFEPFIKSN